MLEAAQEQTLWDLIRLYLELGYIHILPRGLDHILFVAALFLASGKLRDLIWQISAFTLAHTLSLGLAAAGVVTIPGSIVEPVIALTIAFVAIENIVFKEMPRWRVGLVFGFGLVHGLGFAGVLGELGVPETAFLPALFSFNIGVEAGQLSVIALLWLARLGYRRLDWEDGVRRYASIAIGLFGLWWAFDRIFL